MVSHSLGILHLRLPGMKSCLCLDQVCCKCNNKAAECDLECLSPKGKTQTGVPVSWLQRCLDPAVMGIWRVNQ